MNAYGSGGYGYGDGGYGGYGGSAPYGGGGYAGAAYGAPPPPPPRPTSYAAPPPAASAPYGAPAAYGAAPGYGTPPPANRAFAPRAGPPPPPPGADPLVWSYFIAVDTDHSGSIDAKELQRALVNGDWSNFDEGTVKMMVTQFSTRRDGLITFGEFAALYAYVQQWSDAFRRADRDRSGTIDQGEMGLALRNFGFNLEPSTLRMVMNKYSGMEARGGVTFDRFVRACVAVKSLTEGFQRFDPQRIGFAQMSYKDFLETCMKAP